MGLTVWKPEKDESRCEKSMEKCQLSYSTDLRNIKDYLIITKTLYFSILSEISKYQME